MTYRALSRSRFLLITLLGVILLVQVLPQVDLPDTAFQGNTEPLSIYALSVAAPAVLIFGCGPQFPLAADHLPWTAPATGAAYPATDLLELLDRSLRC
jgi:hypothetical protein